MLELEHQNVKNKLQFTKQEYDYFIKQCGFTEFEKSVLDYKRLGYQIKEIAEATHYSNSKINRTIKAIKSKIKYVISKGC